jgi:hypothetical protein
MDGKITEPDSFVTTLSALHIFESVKEYIKQAPAAAAAAAEDAAKEAEAAAAPAAAVRTDAAPVVARSAADAAPVVARSAADAAPVVARSAAPPPPLVVATPAAADTRQVQSSSADAAATVPVNFFPFGSPTSRHSVNSAANFAKANTNPDAAAAAAKNARYVAYYDSVTADAAAAAPPPPAAAAPSGSQDTGKSRGFNLNVFGRKKNKQPSSNPPVVYEQLPNPRDSNRVPEWQNQGYINETEYNRANGFGYGMGYGH